MNIDCKKTFISSAILLALAIPQAAVATEGDALHAGFPILVNQKTAGNQFDGVVAMDANGNFVALWSDITNYDGTDVIARRFNADGSVRGDEFVVNTTTGGNQFANSIAASPSGAFVAVFRDGANGVYARLFNANGDALGDQFQVNTTMAENCGDARVVMAADGSFIVVWKIIYSGYTDSDIRYRRYAADGTALDATDVRANTITTGLQEYPSVAMDPAGNYVIAWADSSGGDYDIKARRYSADGTALDAAEVLVNETTTGTQYDQTVAMDAGGNYVISWLDDGAGVYFKRYAADGSTLNGETAVMLNASYIPAASFSEPNVGMSADGRFAIVAGDWGGDLNDGYETYMQRYDSSANPVYASPVNVGGPAGSDVFASVKMDADGDTVVLYESYTASYDVYAERYEGAGQTVDLSLVGVVDSGDPGGAVTYSFTATNNGNGYALAVNLEDVLPSGVSYTSYSDSMGDGWKCSESGGTVSCTLPSLAPAAQSSIDITVDTSGATDSGIDNFATISNAVNDSNTSNNSNTVTTGVSVSAGGGGALGWLGLLFGLVAVRRRTRVS